MYNEIIKPEDVLILVDGTRLKGLIPKIIIDNYYRNNEELNFKSVYSIKGIIIHANNINDAIKEYKDIKNNLLEN